MADNNNQPGDVVARLLNIPKSELKKLADDGIAIRVAPDKYDLLNTTRNYIAHLQTQDTRQPTQREVAEHLDMSERNARDVLKTLGIDWTKSNLDAIRIAYIRDMREKAAGRGSSELMAKTMAQTREATASAQIKELQYLREVAAVVLVEELEPKLAAWAVLARSETLNALDKLIATIHGKYGITIEQAIIDELFGPAFNAIADYPQQLGSDVVTGGEQLAATATGAHAPMDA